MNIVLLILIMNPRRKTSSSKKIHSLNDPRSDLTRSTKLKKWSDYPVQISNNQYITRGRLTIVVLLFLLIITLLIISIVVGSKKNKN